jgi:hypothetical protein
MKEIKHVCMDCKFKTVAWHKMSCMNPKTGYTRWLPVWYALEHCQGDWKELAQGRPDEASPRPIRGGTLIKWGGE